MKNSTKFLDDIMKNSIHQYLVIDVTDKPTFGDWWRFEEECLGEHFGCDKAECRDWWDTWFIIKDEGLSSNYILMEVKIESGEYSIIYKTETPMFEDLLPRMKDSPCVMNFGEIYNKYLLKPLPETLVKSIEEQPKEFNHQKAVQDLLDLHNKPKSDTELILEEQLKEAQEEIDSLTSTIKDMEEIIKRYEHNLTFIWGILEEKIKESK